MAPSSVPTVDDFINGFPRTPTKIDGRPDYEQLNDLRKIIKENASSVTTQLGGGNNGYLGLVVTPAVYATIAPGTPFNRPAFPGPNAVIPPNATAAQIGEIVRQYESDMRDYNECNTVEKALRKQITDSVDKLYLVAIYNRNTGLSNVTITAIFTHLFDSYAEIDANALKTNADKMNEPWDPSTPLESLIVQIEDACDFAEAGNAPFSEPQKLNAAYNLVFNTGLYFDACKDWNELAAANRTWDQFKTHFLAAQTRVQHQQRVSTQQAGYHGANNMETVEALANLAAAAATDREAFANITSTNNSLTNQLSQANAANATMTATLQTLQQQLQALQKQVEMLTAAPTNRSNTRDGRGPIWDPTGYCYTHGYKVTKGHTSKSCNRRCPDHKENATRTNTMGGSDKNKEWQA